MWIILGGGDVSLALDWESGDPEERALRRAIGLRMVDVISKKLAREIRREMFG